MSVVQVGTKELTANWSEHIDGRRRRITMFPAHRKHELLAKGTVPAASAAILTDSDVRTALEDEAAAFRVGPQQIAGALRARDVDGDNALHDAIAMAARYIHPEAFSDDEWTVGGVLREFTNPSFWSELVLAMTSVTRRARDEKVKAAAALLIGIGQV